MPAPDSRNRYRFSILSAGAPRPALLGRAFISSLSSGWESIRILASITRRAKSHACSQTSSQSSRSLLSSLLLLEAFGTLPRIGELPIWSSS